MQKSANHNIKVFGIGLNKTGTTTLGQCGKLLGYKTISCQRKLLEDIVLSKDFSNLIKVVQRNNFFEDWPWPLIYKELDELFPRSKFILTVRKDPSTWLNSLKKHSMTTHPNFHCRLLAYGYNYPQYFEREHLTFYENHRKSVNEYFANRKNDFIELCWEKGDGWKELCSFLDCEIPPHNFPHVNKSIEQKREWKTYLVNKIYCNIGK